MTTILMFVVGMAIIAGAIWVMECGWNEGPSTDRT